MKKKLIVLCFICGSVHIKAKKKDFMDYVYSSTEVKSLDGLEIRNSEEKIIIDSFSISEKLCKITIKYKGKEVKINTKINIPKEVSVKFIKQNAYVKTHRPILIWQTGEYEIKNLIQDNYLATDIDGYLIPLFYMKVNKDIIQFVICSYMKRNLDTQLDFALYSYNKKEKRVFSGIPLYLAEFTHIAEGKHVGTVSPYYETIDIKDGIVKQWINDGFNDTRERHIRLNEKGYYEIIWARGTFDDPWKYYEGEVDDADGYVNVRETPDTKSKVYYTLKDKQKIIVTDYDEKNKWYLIDSIGGQNIDIKSVGGWIHKSRVKLGKRIRDYTEE